MKSLREIQEEEEQQRAIAAVAAAEAEEAAAAAAAADSLADFPPAGGSGWGAASASAAPSLREVMQREQAASAAASRAAAPAPAAPADEDDGGLFWDYGVQAGAAVPPPPPPPAARKPAAPAVAAKASGWASTVAATTSAAVPAAAARPAARPAAPPAARAAAAPAARPTAPAASPVDAADAAAIAEALNDGNSALTGEAEGLGGAGSRGQWHQALACDAGAGKAPAQKHGPLPSVSTRTRPASADSFSASLPAGAFRGWCAEQMREITGSGDVTLCEFLLTVESNSELAEYCTLYLGNSPGVSSPSPTHNTRRRERWLMFLRSCRARVWLQHAVRAACAAVTAVPLRALCERVCCQVHPL